ncbi:hypothetical protein M409DRAFT_59475 [Zasmidium cellare ATCC 36951]|uniref:FAD-dependent oxidoreductase domain-containing protein 1 n=1 Tax=Zasmidium cellare ATCC 36951 TaxID=1080233 RepID=A0A6A6C3S6_ZASCE|nr:uncharacterized protein M409DRAFT_59475 [Zasmidium cellare ATCC 36951]KAF2160948.1 hypothetical protein M409DRAFT_59475 [Zasmidium cellare ATCC 36951]
MAWNGSSPSCTSRIPQRIAIVGAGWYGTHLAHSLSADGHTVVLIDQNDQILSGSCSGSFGIRLHLGPHYPRSPATRRSCQESFHRFVRAYPELVVWHERSIYGYGAIDAKAFLSKVSRETFERVCRETPESRQLDRAEMEEFRDLEVAFDLPEPSVAIGSILRRHMKRRLEDAGVSVRLGVEIRDVKYLPTGRSEVVSGDGSFVETADWVINATGFQSLLSQVMPQALELVYQVCVGFDYEDTQPGDKPFSFIVMDGWFPCLMPCIDEVRAPKDYVLMHGSYTILGSYGEPQSAWSLLASLNSDDKVMPRLLKATESEMGRFWPEFENRFQYKGWHGTVLAKPRTHCEFRSSLVFAKDKVIHVVPGKISNVFNAYDEVVQLMDAERNPSKALQDENRFQYACGGALDVSKHELGTLNGSRMTDSLQTYYDFIET